MPSHLSLLAAARPPLNAGPIVGRHQAAGELALAIGAFAGRAQPTSLGRLAREAGLAESRLADLAAGRALPDLAEFLSLCAVLPSEFADIALAPAGLGGVRRLKALNGCESGEGGNASRLAVRAAELTALVGLDLGSGESPPCGAAEAEPVVRALKARCERWLDHQSSTTSPFVSPTDPPGGAATHPRARRPVPCPPSGRPPFDSRAGRAAQDKVINKRPHPEEALGAVSKGEEALGAVSKGEEALGAVSKGEEALGAVSKGEEALGAVSKGEEAEGIRP